MVGAVKGHILHQHTKFYKDRSKHYGDIAIFVIFQDGGRRHLEFLKIRIFNDLSAVRGQCASSRQISSKSVKRLQKYGDLTVSITWNFQYFARVAWKRLFTPPKLGFSGDVTPKMGSNVNETPKRHILARVRVVWAIKRENPWIGVFKPNGQNIESFMLSKLLHRFQPHFAQR